MDIRYKLLGLIDAPVLVMKSPGNWVEASVAFLSASYGFLVFSENGTLIGKSDVPPLGCKTWNPAREDFPKKNCVVHFPSLIFQGTDLNADPETYLSEINCEAWRFVENEKSDKNPQAIIDEIIGYCVEKAGAEISFEKL